MRFLVIAPILLGLSVGMARAQSGQPAPGDLGRRRATIPEAPPAPVAPAVVSRNAEGGVSIRATRVAGLKVDGVLDDEAYSSVLPVTDFVQQDPAEGQLATEKTEAWILFDDQNLYVSARCWDSHPERDVANEMRRDANNIFQNENLTFTLDTFMDRRNGFGFYANKLGGMIDVAITDERDRNVDWNAVWSVRTATFEGGWTVEFAIPFKSLRYAPGREQVWGMNLRRIVRWKNELSFVSFVPSYLGIGGILSLSRSGTLYGLEVPPLGLNLDLKPSVIGGVRTDRTVQPAVTNKRQTDFSFDAKYGVTKSLTADFTYNTDFAQVEDDQQQVNLTRFNLFFPEKRDFFLEGQGIFTFAGISNNAGFAAGNNNTPIPFFSRRIGLDNGRPVPIIAGGRMTGRAGRYSIGLLNIESDEDAVTAVRATNFSVIRLKRDLHRRSSIGTLYTRRSLATRDPGAGETFGVDAHYSLSPSWTADAYAARTRTEGLLGNDWSYQGRYNYNTDRYGGDLEHTVVGRDFNPEVGFVRRTDFRRSFAQFRFSPRPAKGHWQSVQKFTYTGGFDYFTNVAGRLDTRQSYGQFDINFYNSDKVTTKYTGTYEFIPRPFAIASGVSVPVGGYDYRSVLTSYLMGSQHKISGNVSYEHGTLYGGTKRTIGYSMGRIELSYRFAVEPSVSLNWVNLPFGVFTSNGISVRPTFMVNPRMFISALVQYNSATRVVSTNARLRWEYQPGSEIFLVYTDSRDTRASGFPELATRAVLVKFNHLFRY